ncbi:hypothetical protein H2198_003059 [Neophaeococcomyces mojaviensis]|uniref:Uncharacterized protein n=1 Tax=Neophaeococcomyces mojaviensis TaxID=3383035 RepID=A0ACC3ACA9_9EURO|nr:hypothetical protein H2198_003059 [Knufia sp. JES_112]
MVRNQLVVIFHHQTQHPRSNQVAYYFTDQTQARRTCEAPGTLQDCVSLCAIVPITVDTAIAHTRPYYRVDEVCGPRRRLQSTRPELRRKPPSAEMAKLSAGRPKPASFIPPNSSAWNPPVAQSNAEKSSQRAMPPPQTRPRPALVGRGTPSQQHASSGLPQNSRLSSGKKKRRDRRNKYRKGRDSFSEHTTSVSGDTSTTADSPAAARHDSVQSLPMADSTVTSGGADLTTRFKSVQDEQRELEMSKQKARHMDEMEAEATQVTAKDRHSGARLVPTISAEQQPMFEKEPEMFHVYASASDESDSELGQQEEIHITGERVPRYSSSPRHKEQPTAHTAAHIGEQKTEVAAHLSTINKSQLGSNITIPLPQKLSNGRFTCPFKDLYSCDKTFADSKGAKRHANTHMSDDRYKCQICDRRLAREDSYLKHLEAHERGTIKSGKKVERSKESESDVQRNGTANKDIFLDLDRPSPVENPLQQVLLEQEVSTGLHEPTVGGEDVDMEDLAVTDAEEEIESDEGAEDKPPNNEAVESITESRSEESSEDSSSDETQSTSESLATDSPHAKSSPIISATSPPIANLKRKRTPSSPQSPVRTTLKASKRFRRDGSTQPPPPVPVRRVVDEATSEATDTESSSESESEADSAAQSADIEIKDADDVNESSSKEDEDSSDEEESTEAERLIDEPVIADSGGENEEEQGRQQLMTKAKSKGQDSPSAVAARVAKTKMSRNGTLDDYIDRSATASTSDMPTSRSDSRPTKASSKTPPAGQFRKKKTPERTTYSALQKSKRHRNAQNIQNNQSGAGEDESEEEKAEVQEIDEETTSSDDRPKATTVARRASSMSSKAKSGPKKVSRKPQKSTNVGMEEFETDDGPKAKSKPKKAGDGSISAKVSKSGLTGRFSDEEIAVLHAWRDSFCDLHNMSHYEFNEMMTATLRKDIKEFQPYEKIMHKRDFLNQYYEQLPNRNRRAMTRFRERHFQNVEKSEWTTEDDDELERLVKELGNKWVEIGQRLGRTQDSVHQRWRHKLNYGKQRTGGDWTSDEMAKLEQEVTAMAQKQGKDPDDSDLDIKWTVVSERLGSGRTAQQCSNRWRINTHTRKGTKFVRVPHADRIPNLKRGPRTPSKMEKRLTPKKAKKAKKETLKEASERKGPKQRGDFKSEEYVEDSDNGGDDSAASEEEEEQQQQQREVSSPKNQKEASDESNGSQESSSKDTDSEQADQDSQGSGSDNTTTEAEQDAVEDNEVMAMIKQKMDDSSDEERSQEDSNSSEAESDTAVVDTLPLPQSQPQKPSQSVKNRQQRKSSQIPTSPQPAKTPMVSRNPFNTETPANALSMTQLINGTQATSSIRPATEQMSRIPETEERPERPSPTISMRKRLVSSPLDVLAQIAVDREREVEATDDEAQDDTRDTLKSPNSFVSAKSERKEDDEDEETEESEAGTESGSETSDASGGSNSTSSTDGASDEESEDEDHDVKDEADEPKQDEHQVASQNSFWKSVNGLRSIIPGLSQPSASQTSQASQRGKKKSTLIDALRRAPVDESTSDDDDA